MALMSIDIAPGYSSLAAGDPQTNRDYSPRKLIRTGNTRKPVADTTCRSPRGDSVRARVSSVLGLSSIGRINTPFSLIHQVKYEIRDVVTFPQKTNHEENEIYS
jgi:hypothetical protein